MFQPAEKGHLVLPALVVIALLSGCAGASSSPGTRTSSSRTPTRTELIAAAFRACRHGVDTGTWLAASSKRQLNATCSLGLEKGLTWQREYGLEICHEVAFTSPATTDAQRERIFATCYAETKRATAMIGP